MGTGKTLQTINSGEKCQKQMNVEPQIGVSKQGLENNSNNTLKKNWDWKECGDIQQRIRIIRKNHIELKNTSRIAT